MTGPHPELRAIFCKALDRTTPEEQAHYLDQACQGKPALRARVEALLRAHEEATAFLPEPSEARTHHACEPVVTEHTSRRLGRYQLLEPLGKGGMGVVWLAQQTDPVKRLVALKIIKPGM